MLSCLRTGDEKSASVCLERLTARFGAENERLMALKGLFQEATAEDEKVLQSILSEYEEILEENPSNMVSEVKDPPYFHYHYHFNLYISKVS